MESEATKKRSSVEGERRRQADRIDSLHSFPVIAYGFITAKKADLHFEGGRRQDEKEEEAEGQCGDEQTRQRAERQVREVISNQDNIVRTREFDPNGLWTLVAAAL